jgi:hypothetical protein
MFLFLFSSYVFSFAFFAQPFISSMNAHPTRKHQVVDVVASSFEHSALAIQLRGHLIDSFTLISQAGTNLSSVNLDSAIKITFGVYRSVIKGLDHDFSLRCTANRNKRYI